jgi:hypothetical protein
MEQLTQPRERSDDVGRGTEFNNQFRQSETLEREGTTVESGTDDAPEFGGKPSGHSPKKAENSGRSKPLSRP